MFKEFKSRPRPETEKVVPMRLTPEAMADPVAEQDTVDKELQAHLELKSRLHVALLDRLNLAVIDKVEKAELKRQIGSLLSGLVEAEGVFLRADAFSRLVEELIHEVMGLGPLEPLLEDPTINDILVNSFDRVYVERFGKLEKTAVRFRNERHLLRIIDKIVSRVGRRIDESQPWVDARLEDGSRVNAIVRPCAVDGPSLSIRKFSRSPLSLDRLVERGALDGRAATFLQNLVEGRMNILISGGTGSGKTTMLNAMSSFINGSHRIVTIEDAAELQLQQDHVVRLETRPANAEGVGTVSQRDLVRNALRMRPDRIIVGEVRGSECFDMLQAMNTGHDGSMTTIHANSARDGVSRLENMIAMAGIEMPLKAVRSQIASAVNLIVQASRLQDGSRRMVSITEITGMEGEVISMQEIFRYQRLGLEPNGKIIGQFTATGVRSHYSERFRQWGYDLPPQIFEPSVGL